MATNADALAQGADTEPTADDPNAQAQQPGQEPGEEGGNEPPDDPEEIKALARDMGWTDKDKFTGPAEAWKSASQYIRDGREIQTRTANELKALRSTVETLGRTNADVMNFEIQRRVDSLATEYQKAVDDGDPAKAFKLANEIGALTSKKPDQPRGPGPEAQEFASRNAGWFQKDPLATSLAIDVCNRLAAQGYDHATQLQAAEKEVRRQYPGLFTGQMNGTKPQASVHAPGSRAPAGGSREKGFADMPLAAQKVANEMIERGVIKDTPENARKLYAKNYWQNAERKA